MCGQRLSLIIFLFIVLRWKDKNKSFLELTELNAINRSVPAMPTGMEKEEESEKHLQDILVKTFLKLKRPLDQDRCLWNDQALSFCSFLWTWCFKEIRLTLNQRSNGGFSLPWVLSYISSSLKHRMFDIPN